MKLDRAKELGYRPEKFSDEIVEITAQVSAKELDLRTWLLRPDAALSASEERITEQDAAYYLLLQGKFWNLTIGKTFLPARTMADETGDPFDKDALPTEEE